VNKHYLAPGLLSVEPMGLGFVWLDTGTPDSMVDAVVPVRTLEKRQNVRIRFQEKTAYQQGLIDRQRLLACAEALGKSGYGGDLRTVAGS
jgi:glucose-1-phosphate thymidylyltransferase